MALTITLCALGYMVGWILCSAFIASFAPRDMDVIAGAVVIGAVWWLVAPFIVLMYITKFIAKKLAEVWEKYEVKL